jgi:hypothetical protein
MPFGKPSSGGEKVSPTTGEMMRRNRMQPDSIINDDIKYRMGQNAGEDAE